MVAAATVLVMGVGLRTLIDQGFSSGNAGLLDRALFALLGIIVVLAIATYSRYSLVSWLGEAGLYRCSRERSPLASQHRTGIPLHWDRK